MIIILLIGFAALLTVFIIDLIEWSDSRGNHALKLRFKDFEKYFYINPKRYTLEGTYVYVHVHFDADIYIRFSYLDHFKYYVWKSSEKKRRLTKAENERLRRYLDIVQYDIELKRKEAAAEIDKAAEIVNQIHI